MTQPTNPPADKELIAKITADSYFLHLIEKEVESRTEEKLSAWWKRLAAATGIILGILAFFGIKEYWSFRDLATSVEKAKGDVETTRKDLERRLADANDKVNQADALLGNSQSLAKMVEESVAASRQGTKDSMALVSQSLDFLADSRSSMETSMSSLESRQRQLLDRAQGINDQLNSTITSGLAEIKKTEHDMIMTRAELGSVLAAKEEVEKASITIKDKLAEAQELSKLASDLNKAKTFTFFMLEEGDSRIVDIAGYGIKFSIAEIAESVDLAVQVQDVDRDGLMLAPQLMQRQTRGSKFKINHAEGLWCEVNAIRSRRIGPDFIFLRIFAL